MEDGGWIGEGGEEVRPLGMTMMNEMNNRFLRAFLKPSV
jgi:hypothetical protein